MQGSAVIFLTNSLLISVAHTDPLKCLMKYRRCTRRTRHFFESPSPSASTAIFHQVRLAPSSHS